MAPALTEPLSPTENLTNSVVAASTVPSTRSSRKLDAVGNKSETSSVKSASSNREKRKSNVGIITYQTPTTSKRLTRFRDTIQRKSLTLSTSVNALQTDETVTANKRTSKPTNPSESDSSDCKSINNNSSVINNEQMGLSTAPLINKNKVLNSNIKNTSQSLDTVDDTTKDSSTAQLLADLTNEALTAEICLRNQLKDVNLVKTPSSPIIPQESFIDTDTDIVVLKSDSPTIVIESDINNKTTAHMEAQLNKEKSSSFLDKTSNKEVREVTSAENLNLISLKENKEDKNREREIVVKDTCHYDDNGHKRGNPVERIITENYMDNSVVGSPQSLDDATDTKKSASKVDILSLQELPPVSTDSTMTASEVEDNIEERLSQLDGTAIDSPPPTNHDVDSNEKSGRDPDVDATPTRTPTHQQNLCSELQALQQEMQQTSSTPLSQQVESDHLQLQPPQPQPQQINCFNNPQSTTSSSMNLLGNVGTNVSHSYIKESENVGGGNAGELEDQDIEEVFKVLKGFEGGTTSDLNVCDLNVLFNEVYMKINETELSGNAVSSGSIASNTQNSVTVANPSIQPVKPTEMEEGQMEVEKRQQQMQRKIDFLLRRLRKLQARYMCKHTSEEVAGLFEWSARQASKGITNASCLQHTEIAGAQDPSRCFLKVISARPPPSDWRDLNETLVPATQISTLLRKIESVANAQQLCTTPAASLVNVTNKKTKRAVLDAQTTGAAINSSAMGGPHFNESKAEEVVVATLEENITDELSQIAGLLQIEMSEVQKAIDSDATESSSGGESADEMVTYNNTQQQTLPITKRAAWRYSRDRAAIASRWSWLLSQIADLEIKIRQHSELHQEVVRSKGAVTCEGQKEPMNAGEDEELMGSCRTRGFMPSLFRKRKLIQTTNIHTISKKAARPSTIKCGCQWPLHPCALCTGRSDPTAPRDLPDTMMMSDRIALLDSGYHPVLSFRENVNNALHFEAIAKQPEWQQRVMRCQAKSIAKNVWRAEREAVAAAAGGHHNSSSKKYSEAPPTKRRYIKKKDRLNNEEKSGGKSYNSSSSTQQQHGISSSAAPASIASSSAASLIDIGNGTASLSTTSSTTPLVANKGIVKGAKKQNCPVAREEALTSLPPPKCLSTTSLTSATNSAGTTMTATSNKKYIHQTSDCLPTNYDQYNPNQTHSSLISNNSNHNSSKSNKHRKLSSSTSVNSHHYNHPNNSSNNLYNGDSSYMLNQEYWGGGGGENLNVRSRTSSPTHGSSGSIYHKYERSLDRKNRTSYDIDNIVIPYSVAAATRVEVLPYKEIPTPKWRLIDNENYQTESSDVKDMSNYESDIETHLDATNITNGHLSESENKSLIDSAKISKENVTSVNVECCERSTSSNSKELCKSEIKIQNNDDTKTNDNKIEEKVKKSENSCQDMKNECNTDIAKEPEIKKLKTDSHIMSDSVKCEPENDEAEKSCKEKELTLQNCSKTSLEEEEDMSDDAMFLRHERALAEERRKFQTYLKFPWSTRSRANRRIDSRAESSGANTPDPSSPAPQTPSAGGGDLESIPSPLNPATPINPLDTISEAGDISTSFLGTNSLPNLSSKHCERRRTTSTKRDRELERRSSTPDSKELIPPYEPLTFPLTDEQFEELLRAMPNDHGEDCKRFDDCYLPGGNGGSNAIILGAASSNKYARTSSGSTSKRSSRASTLCGDTTATTGGGGGGGRRTKSSNSLKNLRPISADDCNADDMLMFDDDYEDDYPKHHLAPDDDHLTADSVGVGNFTASDDLYADDDDEDDVYGDQYGAYVGRHQRKHRTGVEEDSSEEEPFQDDDPNDPEWRGETEERFRKKV